jgi:AraC-like DNA-binding protein
MRQTKFIPVDQNVNPPRGLLHQKRSFEHFELTRFEPSPDLAPYVENYWLILWDLTGKPAYTQENLSHPSQHMVINPQDQTGIFGVATGRFAYRLEGVGRVLGTKFHPGAFHGFLGGPVSALTDRFIPIGEVFDRSDAVLEREFLALEDPLSMAERVETMLREIMPPLDEKALAARRLIELIAASHDMVSVTTLAKAEGVTVRSIQRLFDTYVGVSPKWVIDRYRMIEAVDALNRGEAANLTTLAHALGYFDHAHFSNAFLALTGHPPSYYKQMG